LPVKMIRIFMSQAGQSRDSASLFTTEKVIL
jgi:hypothetical protein